MRWPWRRAPAVLVGVLLAAVISFDGLRSMPAHAGATCRRAPTGPHGQLPPDAAWQPIPPGPVDGRVAASVVWTDEEVIVWGGEAGSELARKADGVAFDPRQDTWRPVPPAPIKPRSQHIAVWTGTEMIVWGGTGVPQEAVPGAAAYDPKRDRWRRIPNAPIGPSAFPVAVWTGKKMIVWGGRRSGGGAIGDGGAAFDPARNQWKRIPRGPLSLRINAAAVWTGCEVVIWGGQPSKDQGYLDDGATYDPDTDRWKRLPAAPLGTERISNNGSVPGFPSVITFRGFIHPNAVWTGEQVLVWGYLYAFRVSAPQATPLAAYNPRTRTWRALASPLIDVARQTDGTGGERAVWAGDSMIAWTGNIDVRGVRTLRYEPKGDDWSDLPSPGIGPSFVHDNAELVLTGDAVVVWRSSGSFILA